MTPNDIDRLRRLANEATKGEWKHYNAALRKGLNTINEVQCSDPDGPVVSWMGFDNSKRPKTQHKRNAAYIAAASPAVVLELIARIGELEKALANVKTAIEHQPVSAVADTLWMPDEIFRGGTIHDYIDHALSKRGDQS